MTLTIRWRLRSRFRFTGSADFEEFSSVEKPDGAEERCSHLHKLASQV